MKLATILSLFAGASAFAPTQKSSQTNIATKMAFEEELGAQPPLGFFDPLGIVADGDEEKFERLRYTEIKHGRICMLGVVGYLYTYAGARLPGNIDYAGLKFTDIRPGFAAFNDLPGAGIAQLVAFIGVLEILVMKDATGKTNLLVTSAMDLLIMDGILLMTKRSS